MPPRPSKQPTRRAPGWSEPTEREEQVAERVGELHDIDFGATAVVSNIYRVANSVRNRIEREVLGADNLSWTGFTALFVLWVWGPQETRHLAEECGVSKGTLTGIVATLERRGLIERSPHATDGRLVLVSITAKGRALIRRLFPDFNKQESAVAEALSPREQAQFVILLRKVLAHVDAT
jgi:DNA-binding MarR family transcriptional regulator